MSQETVSQTGRLHWDATSTDYLRHRPGYPDAFFALLQNLGIGLAGQDILDLGSGTGALAVPFARQKARVTAVDLSKGQIAAGQKAARQHHVSITFKVAPAEETGLPDLSFDVITASMCWAYFNQQRMAREVPRLLRPDGRLLVSTLIWSGAEDAIAGQTDRLLIKYNPKARQLRRRGESEIIPRWSVSAYRLLTYHEFTVTLPFTRESWRGRMRATKWIGAALSPEQTAAFDREHQTLLNRIAPPTFDIRHRITLHIFQPIKSNIG